MFNRPHIVTNDAFDAAGMRFTVVEPFVELRVTYEGPVVLLDDPLQMADPRQAFRDNPHTSCAVDLVYHGALAMFGGEPDQPTERPGEELPAVTTSSWSAHRGRSKSVTNGGPSTASDSATTAGVPATGKPPGTTGGSRATWARLRLHGVRIARRDGRTPAASSGTVASSTSATTFTSPPPGRGTPTITPRVEAELVGDQVASPWSVLNLIPLRNAGRRDGTGGYSHLGGIDAMDARRRRSATASPSISIR